MNFSSWTALSVGLLVLAPFAAHLLQRGKTPVQVFPAVSLVAGQQSNSRERARFRDRWLLALRVAMVFLLAILGATPLLSSSDLALERAQGESLAIAIVVDDSHSMNATTPAGTTRLASSLDGANQLLDSIRDGDSVSLVLAGQPARLLVGATSQVESARTALQRIRASDRHSDLEAALNLAQSTLDSSPQPDQRLVVFSDLAGLRQTSTHPHFSAPLEELRHPVDDCGIASATRTSGGVRLEIACSDAAKSPRTLERLRKLPKGRGFSEPEAIANLVVSPQVGVQVVNLPLDADLHDWDIQLAPPDGNGTNDRAPVSATHSGLVVAISADPKRAGVLTGGTTVLEQAVRAVRPKATIQPLSVLPDSSSALDAYAALLVDDPVGLSPASRGALAEWLERGGVALGLLGPAVEQIALSSSHQPFADRAVRWATSTSSTGIAQKSLSWLGPESTTLASLSPRGRLDLQGALVPGATIVGEWDDGAPFLVKRQVGAGLVFTAGLPVSLKISSFSLRPGFLALIDHALQKASQLRGPSTSRVGDKWAFSGNQPVTIVGPEGSLAVETRPCSAPCPSGSRFAVPPRLGRYSVVRGKEVQTRSVWVTPEEISTPPGPAPKKEESSARNLSARNARDASPQASLLLLILFAAELSMRAWKQWRGQRREPLSA